jgi:hypothetical protein
MPELRDLLHESAPRPVGDLDTRVLERRVRRRRRTKRGSVVTIVALVVVSLTATLTTITSDSPDDVPIDIVTRPPAFEEPLQTWKVPGIRGVGVTGDEIRVLVQRGQAAGPGGSWSVDRFDFSTGAAVDPIAVEGSSLGMTASDDYVWVWGQILGSELQQAMRDGKKELPTSGRLGVVHRIDPSGKVRSWTLATVPIFLTARADRAWAATIDYSTNAWSIADLDGDERPRIADAPNADWGIVLDGDELWLNGTEELVSVDLDSLEVVARFPSRRLTGRTADGRLWEGLATERVAPFMQSQSAEQPVAPLGAPRDAQIVQLDGGVVIGNRWFIDPDTQPDAFAELAAPPGLSLLGPVAGASGLEVFYAGQRYSDEGADEVLMRWVPRKAVQAGQPVPFIDPPSRVEAGCTPYVASFITHNAGYWGESTVADPDLQGAIRRVGPAGSYVQAFPGPSSWLRDLPGSAIEPSAEWISELHLARTSDGYAAVAIPAQSSRAAPCDGVTVVGHNLTRAEMLQQVELLAGFAPNADGTWTQP